MTPTTKTPIAPQPVVNDVAGPIPAPDVVENIPVHNPGEAPRDDDAELDKIMQDVGKDLHKVDMHQKKHHFWELKSHHKKEANFSTQMSIKDVPHPAAKPQLASAPQPAAPAPRPAAPKAPAAHTRVKPVAQKPAKQPKSPKPPKQRHAPVMVTAITILVTAALIAVAYRAYQ